MSRAFSVEVLKVVVGHICQNIGWHNVSQTSLGILVDVLQKYMIELSKCTTSYANAAGRTESNTEDVFLAFRDFGLTERELLDYMLNVDSLPFPKKLPLYPIEQPPLLCFPKTQDPQKPEWIDSHLPSIRPEHEIEAFDSSQVAPASPQIETTIRRTEEGPSIKLTINKRAKGHESLVNIGDPVPAEEGTPMREVGAVLMTPSGFLSAIRDGKLPDPCQPSKLLLDPHSDEDSSEEGQLSKTAKKKRKAKTAESKADKFFDEKVNGAPLVTSIKIEKPVKEKKTKEPKRGRKRKSPGGRSPKAAKAPRLAPAEEKNSSPKTVPKVKLESMVEASHPEPALISDNESQGSVKLRVDENCVSEEPSMSKDAKLLRGIDDAITSVIENARKSIAEDAHEDRARKKLQVDDFYDYLSDSDARSDADAKSNADFSDRPKTPTDEEEVHEKKIPTSGARKENVVKASPLVELVRQMPDQPTNEDSSSFLTPSVTITPIPPKPPTPTPPPPPPITSTLTVKTLAERKGMPPIEVEDKSKKKDKKKERKEKKDKSKKKEVPKLTLKLSSASSLTEQLFAPTPLISTTITPKEKEKEKEKKNSILKAMANEVDSDSDDLSPVKMSSPPTSKALRIKEPKKPTSNKKEKNTPSSKVNPKVLTPLPVTPVRPEITITPIPAPPSKKDKKKPNKAIKKEEKEKKSKEKKDSKGAQVEVVTVGTTIDEDGNKIWICPACAKPDDGSPMIGCDQCDDWYHWECVGIDEPPSEDVQWFCTRCTKNKKPQRKHQKVKK